MLSLFPIALMNAVHDQIERRVGLEPGSIVPKEETVETVGALRRNGCPTQLKLGANVRRSYWGMYRDFFVILLVRLRLRVECSKFKILSLVFLWAAFPLIAGQS